MYENVCRKFAILFSLDRANSIQIDALRIWTLVCMYRIAHKVFSVYFISFFHFVALSLFLKAPALLLSTFFSFIFWDCVFYLYFSSFFPFYFLLSTSKNIWFDTPISKFDFKKEQSLTMCVFPACTRNDIAYFEVYNTCK